MSDCSEYSPRGIQNLEYREVGGCLLFFCFSLVVIAPLQGGWVLWRGLGQIPLDQFPVRLKLLILLPFGIQGALTVFGAVAGIYLWRLHRRGIWLAKAFLASYFPGAMVTVFFLAELAAQAGGANEVWEQSFPEILRAALYSTLWWVYLERSYRVRKTYELKYGTGNWH